MCHASQKFIGITTSLIYFQTGMSATQTFQGNLTGHRISSGRFFLIFQCSRQVNTSGTTDIKFAFIFRVKIQQNFPLQCPRFQTESTIHACFFILRNQSLQRTVLQAIIFQHCHDSSNTQTIISSQRCTFSFYPITIDIGFNRIFCKIVNSIIVLLRHHIHVCLKNDAFAVFHTRSSCLTNDNIAYFIDK